MVRCDDKAHAMNGQLETVMIMGELVLWRNECQEGLGDIWGTVTLRHHIMQSDNQEQTFVVMIYMHSKTKKYFRAPFVVLQLVRNRGLK